MHTLSLKTVDVNWLYIHQSTLTVLVEFAAQWDCTRFCVYFMPPFLPGVCLVVPVHGTVNTSDVRKESALMHFKPFRRTFNQSNANIHKCLYVYCSTQGHADKDVHNQYKSVRQAREL